MANEIARRCNLAILIDAENVSPRIADDLFREVAKIGDATVRRIYGDFSGSRLKSWSDLVTVHGLLPQQSAANIAGKNAADFALVIDAMDLLHTGRFDGFCLVSSDSDFTRLALRIREQGVDVYGFGERKTPDSFRKACKRFVQVGTAPVTIAPVNVDVVIADAELGEFPTTRSQNEPAPASTQLPDAAVSLIQAVLDQVTPREDWYFLGEVGQQLRRKFPGFTHRKYGCSNLKTLIDRSAGFDIEHRKLMVFIRPKAAA